MEGVRVLAEQAIYSFSTFYGYLSALFIVITLGCIGVFLLGISDWNNVDITILVVCTCIFCALSFLSVKFLYLPSKTLDYVEQKVIIEDTINMNEFFNHYELLDQDGEIYIVREKPIE